jgi:hypothetical protein
MSSVVGYEVAVKEDLERASSLFEGLQDHQRRFLEEQVTILFVPSFGLLLLTMLFGLLF